MDMVSILEVCLKVFIEPDIPLASGIYHTITTSQGTVIEFMLSVFDGLCSLQRWVVNLD